MISLDSYIAFASINLSRQYKKAEIFQLHVTCRRGQATSLPLNYCAPGGGGGGGGGWRFVKYEFFVVFFLLLFLFSLKTSPEGYMIYRIVNCVSVI